MKKIVTILVLVSFFAFVLPPAPVQATPATISMEVSWGIWPFNETVTITSNTYANPTLTAKWSGGQPLFGAVIGGEWEVTAGDGTTFTIDSPNFKVTSNNPNLPYVYQADDMNPETGTIGEGHKFGPFDLIPQLPVTVTIGQ